jgi:N-acetylglucosaminyldiphosphoundecaprenol N-acetyl-beta-D-mannosaminyltransferase
MARETHDTPADPRPANPRASEGRRAPQTAGSQDAKLLPPASLREVLRGRAPLVGSRLDPDRPRGWISPVEARVHMGIPYEDLHEAERTVLQERTGSLEPSDAAVIARALLARLWAPPEDAPALKRPRIVSARVDNLDIERAVESIVEPPSTDDPNARMVHFVHAHALNVATFDAEYARLLSRADLVLPDGIGLRIGARMLGFALRHNINGTDLLPVLCETAAARSVPLALVGATEEVVHGCADALRESHPGLEIALVSHGYLDEAGSEAVARELEGLGRCIVLVGMGSPKQEQWAWKHLRSVPGATVLTVGGLFDFYSGRIPRAPLVWRELGLEWVYRLAREPSRLAKRYLLGNPLFLSLALRQRLREGRQSG